MLKKLILTLSLLHFALTAVAEEIKIAEILIQGNSRIETSSIQAATELKVGDQVTVEEVDNALQRIFALGRFDDVTAELTDVQGAQIITFKVHEFPLIRKIEFVGNDKLAQKKLRPLVKMRVPQIYNRAKVNDAVADLKAAYIKDGFHAVKIEPELTSEGDNEATLVFQISEGRKVLIREIKFVGNTVLKKRRLMKKIETRERWFLSWLTGRGAYQQETMEIDIERIKAAYHDVGYQDVKVKPAKVTLVNDKYLDIEIEIEEGSQYRVGLIDVKGDLIDTKENLLAQIKLHPGEVFSRDLLHKSIISLTDFYADSGYAYANIAPLTTKHRDELLIDLNLDVEKNTQVFIERIQIHGNSKTRDKVIRREVPLLEGDMYSARKVKDANRRIRNLGFFDEVNLTNKPGTTDGDIILDVEVKEKPTGTFSVGAGYSSVDKLVAQGSVTQDNFLGTGVRLSLSASLGSLSTTYSLSLTDPYFLDTEWTLGGEIYKSEREYDDYDDYRTGGAIRAGHAITRNSKLFLTYRYEEKEILNVAAGVTSPIILDAVGKSSLSSLTLELIRNSTDYYQDPSSGGISELTLEYAGLGGTDNFVKTTVEHRHFFPLFWGTVFSVHGAVGYVVATTDDDVPLGEKFYLGGIRTLRGFKSREVGPMDGDEYIGGEKMGYFNFEYLFPLATDLGVKGLLFYDTGNAWTDDEDYFSDMRNSVGAGIRWLSPMGPLRLEWGYNLSPRDGERTSVFEFTIGRAF